MQGNHAEQNQRIKMSLYQTPLPETINETTIKAALGALAPCNVCKSDSTHGRGGYWNDTRLDLAIEKAEEKRRQRGDDQFKTIGEALSYLEDGFSLIIEPIEEIPTSYRIDSAWTDMGGGGGGGGGGNYFSPVDSYLTSSGDYLGNYTAGCKYLTIAQTTILGLRFRRWTYAATILGEIWINGSAEAAKSVAVDPGLGPTEFTLTFDTPLVVPAWTMFYATTYDGGTRYAQTGRLPWDTTFATGLTVPVGSTILLMHPGGYKGGTGQPITFSDSNSYPVEPIT